MESLNKVELRGFVGNINTKPIGDTTMTRFSLATDRAYKSPEGFPVIETTRFQCVSFDKEASSISKGDTVHLTGRLRQQRYTASDGSERVSYEVLVQKFDKEN